MHKFKFIMTWVSCEQRLWCSTHISDLMVILFLSLFKVFKGLFSFILSWMSLNSLLLDTRLICTYKLVFAKPCYIQYTMHLYIFLWQESSFTLGKVAEIAFESNIFARRPTRSDSVSVPVTSQNCFIVSKATQYRAINLPASVKNGNK